MMKICIDCGGDYEYDSCNPLGASSDRCCRCRKISSKRNKKLILFSIAAGTGAIQCVKCGYHDSVHALNLVNAVEPISKPITQKQIEEQAKKQFILCSNCLAEVQHNEVMFRVKSSKHPMSIEFFTRHVRVVEERIQSVVNNTPDAQDVEVTTDEPQIYRDDREAGVPKRIG